MRKMIVLAGLMLVSVIACTEEGFLTEVSRDPSIFDNYWVHESHTESLYIRENGDWEQVYQYDNGGCWGQFGNVHNEVLTNLLDWSDTDISHGDEDYSVEIKLINAQTLTIYTFDIKDNGSRELETAEKYIISESHICEPTKWEDEN